MNRWDEETYDRILAAKATRRVEIQALQDEHNRCAWCGVAKVDAGQPYCLTHTRAETIR